MGRAPRPCLQPGCPALTTTGARCPTHTRAKDRQRQQARGDTYDWEWRQISKAAREAQPWCSRCGATTDLTTDHVDPRSLQAGVVVLCRPCNSSKGGCHTPSA